MGDGKSGTTKSAITTANANANPGAQQPAPAAPAGDLPAPPPPPTAPVSPPPPGRPTLLGEQDVYLFAQGTHHRMYDKLGSRPMVVDGVAGVYFAVWAPNADYVAVVGEFNGWDPGRHPLAMAGGSGIWEAFVPNIGEGALYKYHVASRHNGYKVDKADPYAYAHEAPPRTASRVATLDYAWGDGEWMAQRGAKNAFDAPVSIYEVHLGSFARDENDPQRFLNYRELAPRLAAHCENMGFTHVELLPIMEHPFYGSWGYQTTGYFAPTARHGSPQDFMALVDYLHQRGIGVILDWVPSHFPNDEHGLAYFDGTHLYEHSDPRQGYHPDWKSAIFNYSRNEVRCFLLSSALFWLDKYHIDGLRVDAVASMLYLDYSRREGEWIPNVHGGRENLAAISFLRDLNREVFGVHPDAQTYAEESTAWPAVSRPVYVGGLGFGMKWDMGWMHDTLTYFSKDPIHRRYHHNQLTFRMMYAFSENFVLPLSHDEVVHGKGSLLGKMPGDDWQKFANLRLLLAYMFAQPGKKLLFQGAEFGQWREWNHDAGIEWNLFQYAPHSGIARWVGDLNRLYRWNKAMHEKDLTPDGFEWVDCNDSDASVVSLLRYGSDRQKPVLAVFNFTPIVREHYRVGVPVPGIWTERLNSDAKIYWGSGIGNLGALETSPLPRHGRPHSLPMTLPPLAAVFFEAP